MLSAVLVKRLVSRAFLTESVDLARVLALLNLSRRRSKVFGFALRSAPKILRLNLQPSFLQIRALNLLAQTRAAKL